MYDDVRVGGREWGKKQRGSEQECREGGGGEGRGRGEGREGGGWEWRSGYC